MVVLAVMRCVGRRGEVLHYHGVRGALSVIRFLPARFGLWVGDVARLLAKYVAGTLLHLVCVRAARLFSPAQPAAFALSCRDRRVSRIASRQIFHLLQHPLQLTGLRARGSQLFRVHKELSTDTPRLARGVLARGVPPRGK